MQLTATSDTLIHSPDGTTVVGTASTLNSDDQLVGGGYDVLALYGTGTFDLTALSRFSGFEEVTLNNPNNDYESTSLYLPAGQNINVDVASVYVQGGLSYGDNVHLSSGSSTVTLEQNVARNNIYFSTGTATVNESSTSYGNNYYLSSGAATINANGVGGTTSIYRPDLRPSPRM